MNHSSLVSSLLPGQSVRIGGNASCWTTVERSGNGKTIRWVRHTPKGFSVYRSERAQ